MFTGVETAREVIRELNARNYKIVDAHDMTHSEASMGIDIRCHYLNDLLLTFEELENKRDDEHRAYRNRVDSFVKSLPLADGCIGKGD